MPKSAFSRRIRILGKEIVNAVPWPLSLSSPLAQLARLAPQPPGKINIKKLHLQFKIARLSILSDKQTKLRDSGLRGLESAVRSWPQVSTLVIWKLGTEATHQHSTAVDSSVFFPCRSYEWRLWFTYLSPISLLHMKRKRTTLESGPPHLRKCMRDVCSQWGNRSNNPEKKAPPDVSFRLPLMCSHDRHVSSENMSIRYDFITKKVKPNCQA